MTPRRRDDGHYEYEERGRLPDGRVALWAVTSNTPPGAPPDAESAEWDDWNAAEFVPLDAVDAELARELTGHLVASFLESGRLGPSWRVSASEQVVFEAGETPNGIRILRVHLPFGQGESAREWDGSRDDARELAVAVGRLAGENLAADRLPTRGVGWHAELDSND